ncbi:MAG: CvpA family protein [Lautropia sp.]|nr:CvpA family protein [Lautropia sp.]
MLSTYTASATLWDWFLVLSVLISTGLGIWRGFIRTGFGLAGWILAFLLTTPVAVMLQPMLRGLVDVPMFGYQILAFLLIYIACRLAGFMMSRAFRAIGLGGLDRFFGALLGVGRAVLIVTAAAMLAHRFGLHTEPAWQMAHSREWLDALAAAGFDLLNRYQPR